MNVQEAQQYSKLEELALSKMTDAEKVQWFQQRSLSAEDALKNALLEKEAAEVVTKFPKVELGDLAGIRTRAEMEAVAARLQAKVEKAEVAGQQTVEDAVKEALKLKDEEIAEMRKVYGRPRQPQASDVTGAQIQQIQAAAQKGIGTGGDEKVELGTVEAVGKVAANALRKAGLIE